MIDRHLAALPRGAGTVHLSWRLLEGDADTEPFHVERRIGDAAWERVTEAPVVESTNWLDTTPAPGPHDYRVVDGSGTASRVTSVDSAAEATCAVVDVEIDLGDGYHGLIVGDLRNDGRLGTVVRTTRDGSIQFQTYSHYGRPMWTFDTRLPARGGWDGSPLHAPFLCYDVDGDGRTEFVTHAYEGPYPKPEYDTAIAGEWLMVLDAETGQRRWQAPWPAVQSRVMMTVGHLAGLDAPPAIVVQDETYGDIVLTAVDGTSGQVVWRLEQARPGGHNLDIADIDGDGVQEVIAGGVCYAGDGTRRWEAEPFGHTDLSKPARIVPGRPHMQIWYAVENPRQHTGVYLVDHEGRTLWKEPFVHAHYGWVARHAPGEPGLHPHTAEDGRRQQRDHFPIYLPDGRTWLNLSDWQRKNFVPVHWDAGDEVVFVVRKQDKRVVRLLPSGDIEDLAGGRLPEGAHFGRNLACVDMAGDSRENIVTVDEERRRLLVLANPVLATRRGRSPWDDFEYRHDRSQLGSGYYIYLSPPKTTV